MATTQTVLEAPLEVIPLEYRPQDHHEPEDQGTQQGRRVFEADPTFTTSPASRRMIIALLVCANTVQVSQPLTEEHGHCQSYTDKRPSLFRMQ
jgi:hypothetical protein